jgi:hypothetical protein
MALQTSLCCASTFGVGIAVNLYDEVGEADLRTLLHLMKNVSILSSQKPLQCGEATLDSVNGGGKGTFICT